MRKPLIHWVWLSSNGGANQVSTPDLYANNIYTDQIVLEWSPGADNYVLKRNTVNDEGTATEIYNGALTTYTDTGRTADTNYYYFLKAQITSATDSAFASNATYTLPNVTALYLPPGIDYGVVNTTNDYGTVNGANIFSLKSVVNTGGPLLSRTSGDFTRLYSQTNSSYCASGLASSGYCDFASNIDLGTGAFTIVIRDFVSSSIGGASQLFSIAGGERLRIQSTTGCYVLINGAFSGLMTWPVAYTLGSNVTLIIECDGTNVRSSITNGATWSNSVTRPGSGAAYTFSRFGASSAGGNAIPVQMTMMFFANYQLSETQRNKVLGIFSGNDVTFSDTDLSIVPKNLPSTFSNDLVNGYSDFVAGLLAKGHGYGLSKNVFSINDYDIISVQEKITAPEYANSFLFIYNRVTQKLYSPIDLGYYATTEDIHEKPSITLIDNTVYISQMSRHYGGNEGSDYRLRKIGRNFDFLDVTTLPLTKDICQQYYQSDTQYPQETRLGNTLIKFSQRRDPVSTLPGRILVHISEDGGISTECHIAFDSATTNNWLYPLTIYNGNRSEVYIGIELVIAGVSPVRCAGLALFKTTDGITFSNIQGTFSKNTRTSGAITLAEMFTNGTVLDARSLTSTLWSHAYCTTAGMLYGVVGNGNNNGWLLWYQNQGGAITTKTVTFGGDTVVLGTQTDTTGSFTFSYHRAPIVALYKGGTTFDVVALQVNGGNWQPTLYRSTDMGDTWSKIGVLDGIDSTKQHTELEFSQNYHFNNDQGVFTCSKALNSTTSNFYVLDIADL
jgi:hypothetical protein